MLTIEELGMTQEELSTRVIECIADKLLLERHLDEGGDEEARPSSFHNKLQAFIVAHIDKSIAALAESSVLPNVSRYIESLTLQETNKWGEKRGAPLSFQEYLVQRAEHYLKEEVNFEGTAKGETSFSWSGKQTRLTYLVHKHLQYTIESAMKDAVKNVHGIISGALAETCKIQLSNIASSLKVKVETK